MRNPIRVLVGCLLMAPAIAKPTLFIIGDSTVRNQTSGQQGWGDPLVARFDPAKIDVINRAIGGRSSRTFLTEGRWDAVMANLKKGDFVLMQFGHNDGGKLNDDRCRASIKGIGEDTEDIVRKTDGEDETVHSYGWYLRRYITDVQSKGATAMVASPIPRNIWKDGKIARSSGSYCDWAKSSAEAYGADFIPFHHLLADRYDDLGVEETSLLFAGTDHTHTTPAGAEFNAAVMAKSLRATSIADNLLADDLWIPRIFADHMVLQRDTENPIWGTTAPNTEVVASISDRSVRTTSDEHGNFRMMLPALPVGGPHTLEIQAPVSRVYEDVLVGEVWLCSGQSNMDFTVAETEKRYFAGTTNWQDEVARAKHPTIRMFTAEWTMREDPQREIEGEWRACSPATVGDFSAVAYFFARRLKNELDVPVGLITSAYGASTAEAWISKDALTERPSLKPLRDAFWKKFINYRNDPEPFKQYGEMMTKWNAADRKGKAPRHPDPMRDQHNPSVLYNGMIAPFIPYGIRGAIWYQGESNVGSRALYPALQRTLIDDWRNRWGLGDFPFYFVQLAAHKTSSEVPANSSLASMREAQASSLTIANTGMVVTTDIGDEKDVHPRNKQDVGTRLALLALAETYGRGNVPSGPVFKSANIAKGTIRIEFEHAKGLRSNDGPLKHFAIAGRDKKFVWADATIDGEGVLVSSPDVPSPAFVRYAWGDNPATANLYNSADLPAAPFRTDP